MSVRRGRPVAGLGALVLVVSGVVGCSTSGSTVPEAATVASVGSVAGEASAQAADDGSNTVGKVLVFVVENRSRDQMVQGLPWVAKQGTKYGTATDFRGIEHPSLPNYLVMAGGSTFGIDDDGPPSSHTASGPSVFGEALAAGRTARVYAESMAGHCRLVSKGRYVVRHNPWAYFQDERDECSHHDVSMARFGKDVERGRLPDVGMVVPNLCHDAHDCRLSVANTWLRHRIKAVMKGPDWADGHLAVVVTADEDDGDHDQLVLTVVAHPALDHVVVSTALDHYGLSRALAEVAGVVPLGQSGDAASLLTAFGLVPAR